LQRLFSTFANGWPGFGLLIQRLVTGIALLYRGVVVLHGTTHNGYLQIAGAVLGTFILAGLWTPVAGALVAAVELWLVFAGGGDTSMSIVLVTLGGTLAMIGPGAWSIDARLFGRKHIPT
jgi:uncharacterized membrane protein YphA (DoxX/SURF4 family)